LADRLALVQQVEAFVDLVEREPTREQPVDGQPSLPEQVDVARMSRDGTQVPM
jgi:hypothetical protein